MGGRLSIMRCETAAKAGHRVHGSIDGSASLGCALRSMVGCSEAGGRVRGTACGDVQIRCICGQPIGGVWHSDPSNELHILFMDRSLRCAAGHLLHGTVTGVLSRRILFIKR